MVRIVALIKHAHGYEAKNRQRPHAIPPARYPTVQDVLHGSKLGRELG